MREFAYPLRVGAGRGEIQFRTEILPHSKRETYTRVLDDPCIRIVIIDSEERYLLFFAELANMDQEVRSEIMNLLTEKGEISEDHIFFHLNHVHSTPHGWGPFDMENMSDFEKKKMEPFYAAVKNAAEEALMQALQSLRPAVVGTGHGVCASAIVNRNVRTNEGWWLGSGESGEKDDSIGIIRFDDKEGKTIAILFVYNVVPSVLDYSTRDFEEGLERTVSADLAGYSSAYVEREFPGAVAAYLTGAAGDVWPAYCAMYNQIGRGGKLQTIDLGEDALVLAKLQGERIGQQVVIAADEITCVPLNGPVEIRFDYFYYEGRNENCDVHQMRPQKSCEYIPCGMERQMEIPYFFIGKEIVLVGLHCQIGIRTLKQIQQSSPYEITGILSFTSVGREKKAGANGVRKYMPERDAYEQVQYMAQNSVVMPGAAEKLCDEMIGFLRKSKK